MDVGMGIVFLLFSFGILILFGAFDDIIHRNKKIIKNKMKKRGE